jgi:hypothetical protein
MRAGAVHVLYGSAVGLRAAGGQLWLAPGEPADPASDRLFGSALASGDLDGDGYGDLAVAVDASVQILFGSSHGIGADDAIVIDEPAGSLAAGDLDGDGIDDLIVGQPLADVDGIRRAGSVLVMYGTTDGPTGVGSQRWSQNSPGIDDEAEIVAFPDESYFEYEHFGSSLAVGDLDADGFDDLVVGTPLEQGEPGSVNVIYGSAEGLTEARSQFLYPGSAGLPGPWVVAAFGSALVADDFDGDGDDDLAVGAPTAAFDEGVYDWMGAVVVIDGGPDGLITSGAGLWTQDSPGVPGSGERGDGFGSALAAGDFGRSGHAELAIGASGEGIGRRSSAGTVTVLYGGSSGPSSIGVQSWSQDSPGVLGAAESDDWFGSSLTPGTGGTDP